MSNAASNGSGRSGRGSPGDGACDGSSIIVLSHANPDDRPTIIGGLRPTPLPEHLLSGTKLGQFELMEAVGRGGMATVLKARDTELGRIVALKILPPESVKDPEAVARFKQEARAAALLDHEHIARAYHCGEDQGLHFIAFEFVAGDNLRTVIERDGPLPPALAIRYLLHVAHGLKHASERGVVHRDIKPGNILITPEGQAKIVDMGLARHYDAEGGVTQSGVTLGTYDYISPEQALDPRRADVRSDIYSLGCAFYHALTGRPPIPEGTAAQKLQSHQNESPIDPRDLNPSVPEALAAVLAKMMAKDPARRYANADELIGDLNAAAAECGFTTNTEPLAVHPRPVRAIRGLPVAWMITGMAALVAITMLAGPRNGGSVPSDPPWSDLTATGPAPSNDVSATPANGAAVQLGAKSVLTVTELVDALRSADAAIVRLQPDRVYDLSRIADGVTFQGTSLTLEADIGAATATSPPVICVAPADAEPDSVIRPGSLTIRNCRQVTLQGVEFRIADSSSAGLSTQSPAAVLLQNVQRAQINGCRFRAGPATSSIACIGLALASDTPAEAMIRHSLFDAGPLSTGCRLTGPMQVTFHEAGFAPHASAIFLTGVEPGAACDLRLSQCTFMMHRGAVIHAEPGTSAQIAAGGCLFAACHAPTVGEVTMPGTDVKPSYPAVLHQDGEPSLSIRFAGTAGLPNGYYQTKPLMTGGRVVEADAFPDCFADATARILIRNPWAVNDPRPLLEASDPTPAFRLSLHDARLRLPPASGAVLLGVKSFGAGESRIYAGVWPPPRAHPFKAAANERVVWPDAEAEDAVERLYPTFSAAFAALQAGESIVLAVNGPATVPLLAERSLKATIRSAPGFTPRLVAEGTGFTTDAPLFRLAAGELTFENIEIHLKDRQAIVAVAGGASCIFRQCLISLDCLASAMVSAVVIPDSQHANGGEPPKVLFVDTILRGSGRGIRVLSLQAVDVTFENTASALEGSLLAFLAEKTGVTTSRSRVRLKNSTFVCGSEMMALSARRSPNMLAVEMDACILVAADPRSATGSVVKVEDAEATTELARLLSWTGRGSVYAYPEGAAFVDWRSATESLGGWDWQHWQRFARDEGKLTPKLRFSRGPFRTKLASAEAADFALSIANPSDAGADVERLRFRKAADKP